MATPNHDLNQPSLGSGDWHIPLNENFDALDTLAEIRRPSGERDQFQPKIGAKFLATDTGQRYIGDGTEWLPIPNPGGGGGGDGPVVDSAAIELGASDSLQDTINDLEAQFGSGTAGFHIILTPGYDPSVESGTIQIHSCPLITGHGAGENTIINWPFNNQPVFHLDLPHGNPRLRPKFRDLHIRGGEVVFDISHATGFMTDSLFCTGQTNGLTDFSGSEFSGWNRHIFTWVNSYDTVGFDFTGASTPPNNSMCHGCVANRGGTGSPDRWVGSSTSTVGVKLGGYDTYWLGGNTEKNAGPGFSFEEHRGQYFVYGPYVESNGASHAQTDDRRCDFYIPSASGQQPIVIRDVTHAPGGIQPRWNYVVLGGRNVTIQNPMGTPHDLDPGDRTPKIRIEGGADHKLYYDNVTEVQINGGQRITENGVSTNVGNPANTGEWTQGRPWGGLRVRDVANNTWYTFVRDQWVSG